MQLFAGTSVQATARLGKGKMKVSPFWRKFSSEPIGSESAGEMSRHKLAPEAAD